MRRIYVLLMIPLALPVLYVLLPLSKHELAQTLQPSIRIYDRNGLLLREVLSDESSVVQRVSLRELPPYLPQAFIAIEDKNFYSHIGIDFGALLRAAWQNLTALRVVSGASTITQQTARLILRAERSLLDKLWVVLFALRMELYLSKDDILEEYLNRAPFGNQTFGVAAASERYFQKPPSQLTLAEAALLAGLPQSPSRYNPFHSFATARKRQEEVLRRLFALGFISEKELHDALEQPLFEPAGQLACAKRAFLAPHFVDALLMRGMVPSAPRPAAVYTTLDLPLQEACERYVRDHLRRLRFHHVTNAAAIVMDNHTGDILAMVGSADYFNKEINGAYNGALAARQPGSALKPFAYALALEKGMTASTLLPDLPLSFPIEAPQNPDGVPETFFPQNFDKKFHGPVRLRQALACSYNVTAVKVLEYVGVENFYALLKSLGFTTLTSDPTHYGLGLTLGSSEVRLLEMVRAYSIFVRGGRFLPERWVMRLVQPNGDTIYLAPAQPSEKRYLSPEVSYLVADILSDNAARRPAFGANSVLRFPFATLCKTGTTKDFRDNWTFGATEDFTVGVWVGNFDGSPMQNVSGVDGAGPIMRDIMMHLFKTYPDKQGFQKAEFDMPATIKVRKVCPLSGDLVCEHCPSAIEEKFIFDHLPKRRCTIHRLFRIDTRNGALATPHTPREFVRETVFEDYPPEYRAWAAAQHRPLPPRMFSLLDDSLHLAQDAAPHEPKIAYPVSDMMFARDKDLRANFQAIVFRALVPNGAHTIEWILDGEKLGESNAEKPEWLWPIRTGRHRLEAIVDGRRSAPVTFTVIE
ncbi:MAG: penicillin-binding protein 1C [Chloroherpetonaceae bacterium]|nr:penicillin-binding protein 1C [Chloroherpetonaceae bacterium]MDW8020978.1 penicillin-binding protein 1C [Chloroherpetonaceae bacterium]